MRQQRFAAISPAETRRDAGQGYFSISNPPQSAATITGRQPATPDTARLVTGGGHQRGNSSIDGSLMAQLPTDQDMIRVISFGGLTKVVRINDCNTCDEVMRITLRKFGYREDRDRDYCFYVLNGLEPSPEHCRRLSEQELWRIIQDQKRPERNRLILRKLDRGEPGEAELSRAAGIAMEEAAATHNRALGSADNKRSQLKVQRVLGESWDDGLQHPLSPASFQSSGSFVSMGERERNVHNAAKDLERGAPVDPGRDTRRKPAKKGVLRQFFGQRPPSELITSDLTTYFPITLGKRLIARQDCHYDDQLASARSTAD